MEVIEAINNRYTERSFTDQSVTREQITKLIMSAQQAPCSCNLQLMQYVVVDDYEIREKLASIATRKMLWAPVNIIFFIDPRFTVKRHSAVMGLGAAMQNMSLAAVDLGLGTCPMAGFQGDKELKQILNVPDFLEAILILGVGHPKESKAEKKRASLPINDVMHFNQFSEKVNFIKESDNLKHWSVPDLINYRKRIGPVYRYGERFSLQIFDDLVYEKVAKLFSEKISHSNNSVLDVCTYDSRFVKALKDLGVPDDITVSDYFPDVSQSITELHPDISYVDISTDNKIAVTDKQYDAVTMVHKIHFTPDLPGLFNEIARVLKPGGYFMITYENMSIAKKVVYSLRRFYFKYMSSRSYNVYEANPYYKIGPHQKGNHRSLIRTLQKSGLTITEHGVCDLESKAKFKLSMAYAIFKK